MVSKAQFQKIALGFETAVAQPHYNKPSIMVFGKFFTRLRAEDDTIVLAVASMDERDMLLELDPETFTLTDHYRSHPFILARRAKIDAKRLNVLLEQRWRKLAPKKALRDKPPLLPPTTKRKKASAKA